MKKSFLIFACAAAVFAGAFILRQALRHPLPQETNSRRSGAMEALEFWTASRAYPADDIPADKYFRAWTASKRNIKQVPRELASSATWEPIGPTNLHGRTISVAINPQNRNTVYIGTASGGLWRSYGGGRGGDWEMVKTGYPALGMRAIVFDPVDTNVMYVGTGEVYRYLGTAGGLIVRTTRGSYGIGILKTTNGGATWSKSLDWTYNQQTGVQAMKLNPLNRRTVWAATSEGMYKSTDAGATWNSVWGVVMATDVVVHPTDTNRVIGAFGNLASPSGAVYRTDDGGASWLPLAGLPSYSGKTLLSLYAANPNWVYASVCDSTTGVGATWRSTDFGDNWTELSNWTTNGIYGVQGWYSHYVAVHPQDSSQVFTASVGSSKSTDGGVTFLGTSGLYSDNHNFAIDPVDPNVIFSVNDDGVYRSTNFGQSFTDVGAGLQTGQLYKGFGVSTTDSNLAIVQSQDHIPGYLYTGGLSWASSAVDEAGWTAIDPSNDDIMYAVNRFGGYLAKSTNRGASFSYIYNFTANPGAWNSPVVVSPADPLTLFYATSRVFRSTNGGTAFTDISGVLDGGNQALCIGIPANTLDTLYVGMGPLVNNADVFRWVNGSGWTNITGTLPDRYPMDLRVDPTDASVVYIAMGGFGSGHVFKSTDAGANWADISGTLPDAPATSIAIDPLNTNIVYLGTDISVYVSTNAGATWSGFGEGLPEGVIVSDLAISPSNRSIKVGTHGNGAYERKMLNEVPAGFFDYKAFAVTSPVPGAVYDVNATINTLRASFRNNGAVAGTDSFSVKLRIVHNASEVYAQTVRTKPLGVAEIRQVTFPGSYTPTDSGAFAVQAITLKADDDGGNDTLTQAFRTVLAPTIQNYLVTKDYCPYTEMVGGVAVSSGDDVQTTVALPFAFSFDGFPYDRLQISTNGWIEFGTGTAGTERGVSTSGQLGCCGANQNGTLGATDRPTKAVGAWWEDLSMDVAGASVKYQSTGITPSRVFTVQWKNMRAYYDAGLTTTIINFQVRLHESTNEIDISYGPVTAGTFGGSDIGAMIGMKDVLGGDYRYVDFYTGLTGLAGDVTTTLSPLSDWPGPDSCFHVQPSGAGSLSVALSTGWNIVSKPLDVANPVVTAVFPTVIGGTTYAYGAGVGYFHRDTLDAGRGYWSKFSSAATQSVTGLPLDSAVIALDSGWNIIGAVDHVVPAPSGGIISSSVWAYNNGYTAAATLVPGKGYWVKTNAAGPMTLGPVAVPKAPAIATAGMQEITLADAAGGKQRLFLSPDDRDLSAFAMPPAPPADAFDARFAGDNAAGRITAGAAGELSLRTQGVAWPLTVAYKPAGAAGGGCILVEYAGGKAVATHELSADRKIVISGAEGHSFAVRTTVSAEVPSAFALSQNYPNPFNPTTNIAFDLPSASKVRLTVYNALGQQVLTVVDREYGAGRHSVQADLSNLPSGVYLYKIQAGSFSDSKKMVLVR
jgi:photosystem II stability/assembly factor-like uncharacterized protein